MAEINAARIMRQAFDTANTWAMSAKREVEREFAQYPPEARATLIAAYMSAAAGDEIAMSLIGIAETVGPLSESMDRLQESLRSDHPLQGETFGGLRDALHAIAESIEGVTAGACPLCCTTHKP